MNRQKPSPLFRIKPPPCPAARLALMAFVVLLLLVSSRALAQEEAREEAPEEVPEETRETGHETGHGVDHAVDHRAGQGAGHGAHGLRPDARAPIGVMGDHQHPQGEFMFSYRFMRMHMDGNRDGTHDRSVGSLLQPTGNYVAAPTEMNMNMHMFGGMYAPTDWATLMLMVPILTKDMDHRTAPGGKFTTRTKGLGDISASVLIRLLENENHGLHLNAGVGFPTGGMNEKDKTPASMGLQVILPYPMQLGAGTFSLQPGVTYNGRTDRFSWGAQGMGKIQLARNDEDYRLGNEYMLTGWAAATLFDWMSAGARVQWRQWFNISGQDDRLGAPMGIPAEDFVPTADPDQRAGQSLELGPSVNFVIPSGPAQGIRLGLEALLPLYRNLDGPQLETDWTFIAGVEYAF